MTNGKVTSKELASQAESLNPKTLTPAERKARDERLAALGVKPVKVSRCIGIIGVPWPKPKRLN